MVNRSATWAEWDEELLAAELQDLQASDFDLNLTGFDTKEIDDLILDDLQEEDATPPLPVYPVTRTGDLWLCGSHRILCGGRDRLGGGHAATWRKQAVLDGDRSALRD
jgi:hypothetical protein